MPKKDKAKAAEKKARTAAKQDKKAKQKEKKGKVKGKDQADSDAEDVDLEAVLKEYADQQARFLKVTEEPCEPPSARSSATLLASPAAATELLLFGGEFWDGALATFYNDLFVYQIPRAQWRRVTSPNSPLPRSGHAWCRGGNDSRGIYLFGGEFSSPRQGTFYHYNDFWRLEPASREWARVETKKGPPARSGHRMTYFKNYIVLFGGFQDTSQQTKYLQDLWLYDTQNYVWHNPALPPASQKPDARSSFSLLPHEKGAVLYGGYSRVKTNAPTGKKGGPARTVLQPMVHQDAWFLRITPPDEKSAPSAPPTVRWERRKKPANAPNPARAGATMSFHKSRGISFGGVHDVEQSEEGIDSEFFDTLYAWNIDRNRFFQLTLRKPRGPSKKQQAAAERGGKRDRGKADEEELLRNLAALETKGAIDGDEDAMDVDKPVENAEAEEEPPEQPLLSTMPRPRFNAALTVQDDVLYIYGGTYENGDREYTFDEMYAIDLGRLDGSKQIFHRDIENWVGSEDEESDEEDEDDDDDDEEEEDEDGQPTKASAERDEKESVGTAAETEDAMSDITMVEEEQQKSAKDDGRPFPRPFETLRDFFARTTTDWQSILVEELKASEVGGSGSSVKGLRKEAFSLAEERWWDCREEVMAMEDEQEEAGIGEVVNLADKASGGGGGGPARRR